MFAKGHYDQAVTLFQQALERDAGSYQARAGAAIGYLYLALGVIQKELSRSPSNPGLIAEQDALLQRLKTAQGIPWRTDWHAKERRNHLPSNRISLCMIVKDEQEWLAQCLESVQGAVDEIIVVDTGSSDRSNDIARQYGARIVPYVWCDDFAAARNAGLEQATGEWILFLDADEALDAEARKQLRSWTAASTCDGLF